MSTLTEIKKGVVVRYNEEPYMVMEASFLRMQQRKPVMRTKMKNIKNGRTIEYSFKQGEKVEYAEVERKKASYLYGDEKNFWFMDGDSFEQMAVGRDKGNDCRALMKEGQEVNLIIYDGETIGIELPPKVELRVESAPPGIKGDTASGGSKAATLETGAVINVPLFVNSGDVIKVNTESGEYVERVN